VRVHIVVDDNVSEDCWAVDVIIDVFEPQSTSKPEKNQNSNTKQDDNELRKLIKVLELKHVTLNDLNKMFEAIKALPKIWSEEEDGDDHDEEEDGDDHNEEEDGDDHDEEGEADDSDGSE
jgi:ribosomal protein L12E/L44/L45/RPP1/RPP2